MCLDRIESLEGPDGLGWKMFDGIGNDLDFIYWPNGPLPVNEWITDTKVMLIEDREDKAYPCGFHIYKNNSQKLCDRALRCGYTIKKVQYRNVVAVGYEGNEQVVVAREMKIL